MGEGFNIYEFYVPETKSKPLKGVHAEAWALGTLGRTYTIGSKVWLELSLGNILLCTVEATWGNMLIAGGILCLLFILQYTHTHLNGMH